MQSDRRHELESNELADSVAAVVDRLRPHFFTLGLATVAVVLGYAAWTLVQSRTEAERVESWEACLAALDGGQPAAVEAVANRYPGSPAAAWSRFVLADGALDQGSRLLLLDRTQAMERLQAAVVAYQGILGASPPAFVAERATFGLAKAQENLGNLAAARQGYETVVREYPSSAVRPLAEARIAALGQPATAEWYAWFAQQKPAPPKADGAQPASESPAAGAAESGADGKPAEPAAPATPAAGPADEPAAGAGAGTDAPR